MFMALLLGTVIPTDTLDADGPKKCEDVVGPPIFDLAEIDGPVYDGGDFDDNDGEPLFVRADITAPDERERKPRDEDRPVMWAGIIGGMSPLEDALEDRRLRTVREPTTAIPIYV